MAQQASDSAQAASTVVLPMALQALVVSEDILRTPAQFAPLIEPNYATLLQTDEAGNPKHDLMDDIDVSYWRTQARFNPRFVDLGTGKLKPDRTGIYLSWCLPKIYRAAITPASSTTQNQAEWNSRKLREGFRLSEADKKDSKDGQLKRDPVQFRPVPDRWFIVRSVRNNPWYGKRFIVESNCIRRLDDPDIVGKTETQTCPAMDPTQPSQEQPVLRLGRALQLDASYPSSMDPVRRRYREPFCAAELGHEFFPDYAPHNMGTFSFFDDLKDVADADIYHVDYLVIGFHSNPTTSDPFTFIDGDRLLPIDKKKGGNTTMSNRDLLNVFNFTVNEECQSVAKFVAATAASTGRTLCHGALLGAAWNRSETLNMMQWPAVDLQHAVNEAHPVSIGMNVMDALAAHVHTTAENEGISKAHDSLTQLLVRHAAQETNVDKLARAAEDDATSSFLAYSKDVVWKLPKAPHEDALHQNCDSAVSMRTSQAGPSPAQQRPTFDDQLMQCELLARLNEGQMALDACAREQQQLLQDLYGCWWNANSIKHIPSGPRRVELEAKNKRTAQSLESRLNEISSYLGDTSRGAIRAVAELKQQLEGLIAKCQPLAKTVASPFGAHQDPTVLIAGMRSAWPKDFSHENSPVRVAEELALIGPPAPEEDLLRTVLPGIAGPASRLIREFYATHPNVPMDPYGVYERPKHTQGWFPLFLEWKIEYRHVPFELWEFVPDTVTGQWRYEIPVDTDWGAFRNGQQGIEDARVVGGRIACLPQAGVSLRSMLKQLFAPIESELETSSKARLNALKEKVGNLEYFSSPLAGLADHLATRCRGHYPYPDQSKSEIREAMGIADSTLKLLNGDPAQQEVAPYGLSTELSPAYTATFSPFKPVMHGQARFVKFAIVDKFGQVVSGLRMTPDRDGAMYPNVSPSLACGVRPADHNQQCWPNTIVDLEGQHDLCQFFELGPRINQRARLNTHFLTPLSDTEVAGAGDGEFKGPVRRIAGEYDNPIWAWLLPNFQSHSIQVYLPTGDFLVEVLIDHDNQTTYTSRGPMESAGCQLQGSGRLPQLVEAMISYTFTTQLFDMLAGASDSVASSSADFDASLPAAMGRPFCVADVGVSIELSAPPLNDASLHSRVPTEKNLVDYEFKVAVGNPLAAFDGLVGTFPARGSITKLSTAFTRDPGAVATSSSGLAAAAASQDGSICSQSFDTVRPYFVAGTAGGLSHRHREHLRTTSVIMDPRVPLRVYTGSVFPVADLSLPQWTADSALRSMRAFFAVGPVLIPRKPRIVEDGSTVQTAVQMPLGGAQGAGAWKWLQPSTKSSGQTTSWASITIKPTDASLRVEDTAQSQIVEGYILVQ